MHQWVLDRAPLSGFTPSFQVCAPGMGVRKVSSYLPILPIILRLPFLS